MIYLEPENRNHETFRVIMIFVNCYNWNKKILYKAFEGIQRVRRHQALRERVMEPSPIQLPDSRLSPPDSFQDNESGMIYIV